MSKRVVLLSKYISHYRLNFIRLLKPELTRMGIELKVIYGQPGPKDEQKGEAVNYDEGIFVPNRIIKIHNVEIYWQPVLHLLKDADLVIVEQASKLLVNYWLLVENMLGVRKLAFWGHGRNFQAKGGGHFGEWIKKIVSTKVHWWFAYTSMSAQIVRDLGYPRERISVVQNSIDTNQLRHIKESLPKEELEQLRSDLKIKNDNIGLYVGGMYPEKGIDYLLRALPYIREQVPDFEMIFIGSGSEAEKIVKYVGDYSWIHYLGTKFGVEKVPYFALSKVFLLPGVVGLVILDCFATGLPMVTTNIQGHGPEIEYLQNGINGIMIDHSDDPRDYAQAVVDLLLDTPRRQKLVEGCISSSSHYSIEEMVEKFASGVYQALER